MKKIIALSLIAAMALGAAACRKTPEKIIVAPKNMERMMEKAREAPGRSPEESVSLKEKYAVPDRLEFGLTGAGGKLSVSVDAPVILPEGPLPIARVSPAQFDQQTVSRFWEVLIGGTPMFIPDETRTKADIQEEIIYYTRVRDGLLDSLETPEEAQAELDRLQEEFKSAPEEEKMVPADGKLKYSTLRAGENNELEIHSWELDAASEAGDVYFSVRNDYDNDSAVEWNIYNYKGEAAGSCAIGVSRNARLDYRILSPAGNMGHEVYMGEGAALPEQAAQLMKTTPDEARAAAGEFLARVGLSDTFAVKDVYLANNSDPINGRPEISAYAYIIECTRIIENAPCASLFNAYASETQNEGERFAPSWGYEKFSIRMDDSGIFNIVWSAPMSVNDIVVEDAALLPFPDIRDIADKMFPIVYADAASYEHMEKAEIKIDRIDLALQRVAECGNFFAGAMVPVWNFHGTQSETWENGSGRFTQFVRGSFLSVNAVDGTIIDADRGY